MKDDQSKDEVGVVVRNTAGRTEILLCPAPSGVSRVASFEGVRRRMEALGYETLAVFDSADQAFDVVVSGRRYKRFFDDAIESLQDAFVPGRQCSGADTIDWVNELIGRHSAGESVYIAASADGYWSNRDGWSGEATEATLERDPARLRDLHHSGALAVLKLGVGELDQLEALPSIDHLEGCAEGAMARARMHGFAIGDDNAAEVLAEELELAGQTVPALVRPFLGAYMLHAQRAQQVHEVEQAQAQNNRTGERE